MITKFLKINQMNLFTLQFKCDKKNWTGNEEKKSNWKRKPINQNNELDGWEYHITLLRKSLCIAHKFKFWQTKIHFTEWTLLIVHYNELLLNIEK